MEINRENALALLYEVALATTGDTRVKPLISKSLQQLMYQTGYAGGVYLSRLPNRCPDPGDWLLEAAICRRDIAARVNTCITVPRALTHGAAASIDDVDLLQQTFGPHYLQGLRLPVGDDGVFILLSPERFSARLPFERLLPPLLNNFAGYLGLCRQHEAYTERLQNELTEKQLMAESLRESQHMLQHVFDTIPARVFWKDINGVYLGCNRLFAADAGYSTPAGVIGKTDLDLPWKAQAASLRDDERQIIEHNLPRLNYQETQQRLDGSEYWLETSKIPLTTPEGDIIGVLGTYYDISSRKQAEFAMLRATEAAEKASQAKSEFLSHMSHELRTPLNAVLGFSQLLESDQETPLNPDQLDSVHEIFKAGQHLLNLINDILDLSKIESQSISLSLEPVALHDLLAECTTLIAPIAQRFQVVVQTETRLPNHCEVHADNTRLKQVLLNLMSNAVKYNHRGGQVSVSCAPASPGRIRIAVQDTGAGLSQAQQDKLFQPFERLGAERGTIEGSGIGLVITKKLVEMMGGTIGIESMPGNGSTFWIELNGLATTPSAPTDYAVSAHTGVTSQPTAFRYRILYIEDNPASVRLMEKLLKRHPEMELQAAHEPQLGLELARANPPDLMFVDINLPGMSGIELVRQYRAGEGEPRLPLIALSANAMPSEIQSGLDAGFDDYLVKPLNIDDFNRIISHYLHETD